jgi:hypothetical protein
MNTSNTFSGRQKNSGYFNGKIAIELIFNEEGCSIVPKSSSLQLKRMKLRLIRAGFCPGQEISFPPDRRHHKMSH